MYLKEKWDGRIKGHGCADGRLQWLYIDKVESSSPTASLPGIIMTYIIYAYEESMATCDIPGAFLETKMPPEENKFHHVLHGRMAELLAKLSSETCQKYVHHKRRQAFIYWDLTVALYGTLKAALLFWIKLSKSLKARGFKINPYDWCITNKIIDGTHCTIMWHVDDQKISHNKPSVVDQFIASQREDYEKIGEVVVKHGKVHEHLGMISLSRAKSSLTWRNTLNRSSMR